MNNNFISNLAKENWKFVLCSANTKKPISKKPGCITTDLSKVFRHINNGGNIAGHCPPGVCVFDIDKKHNKDGEQYFRKYFFNTFTVKTPNGGYHTYCRIPHIDDLKSKELSDGLEFIYGDNRHVMLPGSIINGRQYSIINTEYCTILPSDIHKINLIKNTKNKSLLQMIDGKNIGGNRNNWLWSNLVCAFLRNANQEEIDNYLFESRKAGLDIEEIQRTLLSAKHAADAPHKIALKSPAFTHKLRQEQFVLYNKSSFIIIKNINKDMRDVFVYNDKYGIWKNDIYTVIEKFCEFDIIDLEKITSSLASYSEIDEKVIFQLSRQTTKYTEELYQKQTHEDMFAKQIKIGIQNVSNNDGGIRIEKSTSVFDTNTEYILCKNGAKKLFSNEFISINDERIKQMLFTKYIPLNYITSKFDQSYIQLIKKLFDGKEDYISVIINCITHSKPRAIYIAYGEPNIGKTVIANVLSKAFEGYVQTLNLDFLKEQKFETFSSHHGDIIEALSHKVTIGNDVLKNRTMNKNLIHQLVDGDNLKVRQIGQKVQFVPVKTSFILTENEIPKTNLLKDHSESRRILAFEVYPPDSSKELSKSEIKFIMENDDPAFNQCVLFTALEIAKKDIFNNHFFEQSHKLLFESSISDNYADIEVLKSLQIVKSPCGKLEFNTMRKYLNQNYEFEQNTISKKTMIGQLNSIIEQFLKNKFGSSLQIKRQKVLIDDKITTDKIAFGIELVDFL